MFASKMLHSQNFKSATPVIFNSPVFYTKKSCCILRFHVFINYIRKDETVPLQDARSTKSSFLKMITL